MRRTFAFRLAFAALLVPAGFCAADENDELFQRLDKNSDGQIAKDEIDADKARLFERLVRSGDKNDDGQLNREEFTAAIKDRPAEPAPAGAPGAGGDRPSPREIFQRFDKNGDGKLSKEEAPERMQQNWDRIDRNSDGSVTPDELAQAFQALARGDGKPNPKPEAPQRKPDSPPTAPERKPEVATPAGRPGLNLPPLYLALDANRDGELSAEEIAGSAKALAALDKNGDGKLTRDELFPNMPANFRPGEGGGLEMLARLREADKDGDGKISREEVPERLLPIFDRVDANRDGKLDEVELRQIAERLQAARRPDPKP